MNHTLKGIFIVSLLLAAFGCRCGKNRQIVNLEGIEVNLNVKRFDKIIFQLGADSLSARFRLMNEKYDGFLSFYVTEILGLGNYEKQPEFTIEKLNAYLRDPYVNEVREICENTFSDFTPQLKELELAFRHFKYYFPEKPVPAIATFISNFSYSAVTFDSSYLGIGLDMYLGREYKYYPDLYPKFMYEKFSPEYLTSNCMKAIASLHFNLEPADNKLLSQMIKKGLELHFADLMLPREPDYRKIGYLPEEVQWCIMNEAEIWKFFVEKEMLYSTDQLQNRKYVMPGPAASGMPREAPGNVGSWVGWQIVRAYVKKHPDVGFEEMLETDAQEILVKSAYKPGRNIL